MSELGGVVNEIFKEIKAAKKKNDRQSLNASFLKLFDCTALKLQYIARTYLREKHRYEECVSNVFTKVFLYVESHNPKKDGYNWLCRITQKEAYSMNKPKKEKEKRVPFETAERYFPEKIMSVDDYVDVWDLRTVQKRLSEKEIQLLNYIFHKQLTLEEIGKRMGYAKSTLSYHYKQILEKLRKNIK